MSDRYSGWVVIGGLVASAAFHPLPAQDAAALEGRYRAALAQLDSVRKLRSVNEERRMQRVGLADTISLVGGSVRLVTTPGVRPIAEDAAPRIDSLLGSIRAALPIATPVTFSIWQDSAIHPGMMANRPYVIVTSRTPKWDSGLSAVPADGRAIARHIVDDMTARVLVRRDAPFARWRADGVPLYLDDEWPPESWGQTRLDVVTASRTLGPRCHDGETAACEVLLGLREVSDPATTWFDSAGRAKRVADAFGQARHIDSVAARRCGNGSDADCISLLRRMPLGPSFPRTGVLRSSIVRHAVRLGGDRAVERLLMSDGPPAEAIAAAAGVPLDSVVRSWQRRVRTEGVVSSHFSPRILLIALGWAGAMLFLAMRSSRWR